MQTSIYAVNACNQAQRAAMLAAFHAAKQAIFNRG
jgi:hypothetical protein